MGDDEGRSSDDRSAARGILGLFGFGMFMFTWVAFDEVAAAENPGVGDWASVAFPLAATIGIAWVAYRIATGPGGRSRSPVDPHFRQPAAASRVSGGFSKEFLITTALAVIGLVISAFAVWRT